MELWITLTISILLQFVLRCHESADAFGCSYKSLQPTHNSLKFFTKSLAGYVKKFLGSEHQKLKFMEPIKTKSNQSTKNTFKQKTSLTLGNS